MKIFNVVIAMALSVPLSYAGNINMTIIQNQVDEYCVHFALDKNGREHVVLWDRISGSRYKYTILENDGSGAALASFEAPSPEVLAHPESQHDVRGGFIFTQNLFNDDDNWEYIVLEGEGWGDSPYTSIVYNDNGELLGSFQGDVYCIVSCGSTIYAIYEETYESGNETLVSFKGNYSQTRSIALQPKNEARAIPNPVAKGSLLTIELGRQMEADGKMKIVNGAGQQVFETSVKAGESNIQIPFVVLPKGVYIYTIESNKQIIASDRIVVD